ncbi:hypothetical protein [Methanobrevibacter sp.]|uniref:hypothetical protein n=1 Tax=Methanobrevibacter sp. TaxID=66852 RepID=UPI003890B71A
MSYINAFKIDDRGAFVLPFELKLKDQEFLKYCRLDVDWDIPSVSGEDLPDEFSQKALKLVDLFRRKTAHLPYECMLFFDYKTGEIIYCFVEDDFDVFIYDEIYESHFEGKNVASIHNHPKGFLSAPSGENFQILEIENEDYELICGHDEFWILEAKGVFDKEVVEEIRSEATNLYLNSLNFKGDIDDVYSEFLIKFISDEIKDNIKLTKLRYH